MPTSLLPISRGFHDTLEHFAQTLRFLAAPGHGGHPEPQVPDRSWLLETAQALQTTLDVERLVGLFSARVGLLVPHASIAYAAAGDRRQVSHGEPRAHACRYDIVLVEERLGSLRFTREAPFTESELMVLEYAIANLVHPLRNALLYEEALNAAAQDPLTGVGNRTSLDRALAREVELARRHGTPLAVILLDADHFKAINDRHGHAVGDCVLKALAGKLAACIRDSDMLFRYGGEEFTVLLSNTQLPGARLLAERIRGGVEAMPVSCHDLALGVTVSMGVAELEAGDDRRSLLERADAAMYRSKAAGRNRVKALTKSELPSRPAQR